MDSPPPLTFIWQRRAYTRYYFVNISYIPLSKKASIKIVMDNGVYGISMTMAMLILKYLGRQSKTLVGDGPLIHELKALE